MPVLLRGQVDLKERTRMGYKAKQVKRPLTKKEIAIEKEKIMENVLGVTYKRLNKVAKKNYLKMLDEVVRRNPKAFNRKMNEFEKYHIAQIIVKQLKEQEKADFRAYTKAKTRSSGGGGGRTMTTKPSRSTTKTKKTTKSPWKPKYQSKWGKYRK